MDKQKRTIKVYGIGSCIDCGRVFVFDAVAFTLVDSSLCRNCSDRINGLKGVDGLPPIGGEPGYVSCERDSN